MRVTAMPVKLPKVDCWTKYKIIARLFCFCQGCVNIHVFLPINENLNFCLLLSEFLQSREVTLFREIKMVPLGASLKKTTVQYNRVMNWCSNCQLAKAHESSSITHTFISYSFEEKHVSCMNC